MNAATQTDPRAARLLEHFDLLLATPDDVAHLEAAILQLAVQGKLVPQDPDDEPVSVLLKRIKAEKEQLVSEGRIHKTKALPFTVIDDIPYELPEGWIWCRLEDLFFPVSTREKQLETKEYQESGKFAVIGQGQDYITAYSDRADKVIEIDHPVIVFGDHTREIKYIDFNFIAGADGTKILSPFKPIYEKFFYYVLRSYRIESRGYARHYNKLVAELFPLPPLAEQKRIVAKVDALLAQTRALAAQLEQADAALIPAAQAAFQSLPDALRNPTGAGARQAWQHVAEHFDTLTGDPRTLSALKQTILQLAVEGKLVPQNLDDEPASVLLERIETEKERLVQEGKIKKLKQLPNIKAGELPYTLPDGWQWTRFGSITNIATNLTDPKDYPNFPHVAPNNIEKGTGKLLDYNTIQEDGIASSNHHFYPGQLLYSKIRPNLSKAVVIDFEGLCSADMYPIDSFVNTRYLLLYILSSTFLDMVVGKDTRVAMPKINQTELDKILVAVPPLAEQKRIVAKVESLLALCDALAAGVVQAEEVRARLLQAVLNGDSSDGGGR